METNEITVLPDKDIDHRVSEFIQSTEKDIRTHTKVANRNEVLYHYTNIETLFSGIIVKDETTISGNDICLWASDTRYMNDPNEIKAGQEFLEELISLLITDDPTCTKSEDASSAFSISLSQNKDSLPMWGMYGKNGSGIALGFDRNKLINNSDDKLLKCIYLSDSVKDKIRSHFDILEGRKFDIDNKTLLYVVAAFLFCYLLSDDKEKAIGNIVEIFEPYHILMMYSKNQAYSYEKEVRLLDIDNCSEKIKYRHSKNLIIPYVKKYFPKEALVKIVVGPTNDMKRTITSIEEYLKHMGFTHEIEIVASEIPYRG